MKYIPLEELEVGKAYELESRNLSVGVWDGKEFHGIRTKFGNQFMDSEIHYDLDDHYGTAQAVALLTPYDPEFEDFDGLDIGDACPTCGETWTGTLSG